ncbi:MAG: hypothetical protein KBC15_02765 [Candidatus Levybacteria bacterium]|nr:hypothetical protein [Candidatus Levybacteria bacterium]
MNMTFINDYGWILSILLVWDMIWKGFAMWRASKNNQKNWFIAVFILNTAGILPILYLKFFSKK